MKRWFLPEAPDLLGLLGEQAAVTLRGVQAFAAWSGGELAQGATVRAIEHEADDARHRLERQLRVAFSTPIDAEDIYELSERLDVIVNGAKNAIREAEVMGVAPDPALAEMAGALVAAVGHLVSAITAVVAYPDTATAEADAAKKCERAVERTYRVAMSGLLDQADLREVTARRELYRRYARLGDDVVAVAERVWYSVVKLG